MSSTAIAQRQRFSVAIQTDGYQRLINSTLGDPERAKRFIAAVSSAVAVNPVLQECDAGSILAGALLGESLNLSPSPQLGMYYLVPYDDKKAGVKKAQFQIGYIGLMQLAQNTGLYRRIRVMSVKKGELRKYDPFTGDHVFEMIPDPTARAAAETVGYFGFYELVNGYREESYWTHEEMLRHADRYSKAFKLSDYRNIEAGKVAQGDMWKYSSPWYTSFETMAHKTVIRQLLKTAPKSAEMRHALESDERAITAGLVPEYTQDSGEGEGVQDVDESTGEVIEGAPPEISMADLQ